MKKSFTDSIAPYVMLGPGLIIVMLFLLYPITWSLIVSFKDASLIELTRSRIWEIPGEFVGLESYRTAITDELFLKSLFNSLVFAIVYVPLTLVISRFLAIQINKKVRGVMAFRTIIFMPYILSVVSTSVIFMAIFRNEAGLINGVLSLFGVTGPGWLSDERTAMPVISLMTSWRKMGYYMLIFLTGLQSIPDEVLEAADIDGATGFQRTVWITIPLLAKMTWLVLILSFIDVFRVFGEPFVMTGGGPQNSTLTMPFLIYNEAFQFLRVGVAAALSYLLLLISLVFVFIQHIISKKKIDY